MSSFTIEQASFLRRGEEAPELSAKSFGFSEEWHESVKRVLLQFGVRPPGMNLHAAVFAQPLGNKHVMVVHVADPVEQDRQSDAPLGYHVMILPRAAYRSFVEGPFSVVERFAPDWNTRVSLPSLSWPHEPPPRRTIEQVRKVLQRVKTPLPEDEDISEHEIDPADHAESPALLGGVQVLVDGGRLVFERNQADTDLLKALWTLLPSSTRTEIWPASFAFSNQLGFDVLVVQDMDWDDYSGYTTEEQAADYPEGRYELNLQVAAETGNQRDLDALFERRSWNDTWRLAVTLLIAVVVLVVLSRLLLHRPPQPPPEARPPANLEEIRAGQARIAAGLVGMNRPLETVTVLEAVRAEGRRLKDQLK